MKTENQIGSGQARRDRKRRILAGALSAVLAGTVLGAVGCESDSWSRTNEVQQVTFALRPSRTTVMSGESVVVTTESRNTLGRDPKVEWASSGGKLTAEDNGRSARIMFAEPGTYTVTAKLYLGDRLERTDSTSITVRPVP